MKIVVTGATGHIGSLLIRELATKFAGSKIVMIDNMMTNRFPSLFNLPATASYRFIEADLTHFDLTSTLKDAYVLIHLAAITDAAGSFDKAELVERNNYHATLKVANACALTGTRLITISSTSVYGTQSEMVSEECPESELKPQSPYAVTKLREEELVARLSLESNLKAVSCRFGTIFGTSPGMRFHTAVNKFCWQAVMGQPISIWSTAYDQKRPYLDIVDAVNAIAFLIKNDIFNGKVFNVLTHNLTVRQVTDTIKDFLPEIQIQFVDHKIMNQMSYEVSCDRFLSLGFSFEGNLKRGIFDTISLLQQANN